MKSKELGLWGEQYAADRLIQDGYQIIARNFRCRTGEVDIIAQKNEYIVFIEVKTRKEGFQVAPVEAVDWKKQKKIFLAASDYLLQFPTNLQPAFDVIEIVTSANLPTKILCFHHYKNAFDCGGFDEPV